MKIKNKNIIGISIFPIFVIYFIYLNDKAKNNLAEIQKEYPTLNFNTRLNGIVK